MSFSSSPIIAIVECYLWSFQSSLKRRGTPPHPIEFIELRTSKRVVYSNHLSVTRRRFQIPNSILRLTVDIHLPGSRKQTLCLRVSPCMDGHFQRAADQRTHRPIVHSDSHLLIQQVNCSTTRQRDALHPVAHKPSQGKREKRSLVDKVTN